MNKNEKLLKQLDKIMEEFDKFYIYVDSNLVANCTPEMDTAYEDFTKECNKMKDIIYNKRGE